MHARFQMYDTNQRIYIYYTTQMPHKGTCSEDIQFWMCNYSVAALSFTCTAIQIENSWQYLTDITKQNNKAHFTDAEATNEAVDMLTHNALNLASKTGEVLRYIEIVSATGKVLPSNREMLSNGM